MPEETGKGRPAQSLAEEISKAEIAVWEFSKGVSNSLLIDNELTPEFLLESLAPFINTISSLQHTIDELRGAAPRKILIRLVADDVKTTAVDKAKITFHVINVTNSEPRSNYESVLVEQGDVLDVDGRSFIPASTMEEKKTEHKGEEND